MTKPTYPVRELLLSLEFQERGGMQADIPGQGAAWLEGHREFFNVLSGGLQTTASHGFTIDGIGHDCLVSHFRIIWILILENNSVKASPKYDQTCLQFKTGMDEMRRTCPIGKEKLGNQESSRLTKERECDDEMTITSRSNMYLSGKKVPQCSTINTIIVNEFQGILAHILVTVYVEERTSSAEDLNQWLRKRCTNGEAVNYLLVGAGMGGSHHPTAGIYASLNWDVSGLMQSAILGSINAAHLCRSSLAGVCVAFHRMTFKTKLPKPQMLSAHRRCSESVKGGGMAGGGDLKRRWGLAKRSLKKAYALVARVGLSAVGFSYTFYAGRTKFLYNPPHSFLLPVDNSLCNGTVTYMESGGTWYILIRATGAWAEGHGKLRQTQVGKRGGNLNE
ncbi:hypothetical protein B0H19DRAFT_1308330 [Mycena capillaripes]|nr:hypothetical protein B0H19DRAFT_1308330 [Mycena capillaripes]